MSRAKRNSAWVRKGRGALGRGLDAIADSVEWLRDRVAVIAGGEGGGALRPVRVPVPVPRTPPAGPRGDPKALR